MSNIVNYTLGTADSSDPNVTTVRVDPSSELGQTMLLLNKTEEEGIIKQMNADMVSGKATPNKCVELMDSFMRMYPPGGRAFSWLRPYRDELAKKI